jgi:hypothetical protein
MTGVNDERRSAQAIAQLATRASAFHVSGSFAQKRRLFIPCQSAGVKQTVSARIRGGWLAAYVTRGEARPAYKRAFAAQLAVYTGKPPTG